jgi:hypothetical protein
MDNVVLYALNSQTPYRSTSKGWIVIRLLPTGRAGSLLQSLDS